MRRWTSRSRTKPDHPLVRDTSLIDMLGKAADHDGAIETKATRDYVQHGDDAT